MEFLFGPSARKKSFLNGSTRYRLHGRLYRSAFVRDAKWADQSVCRNCVLGRLWTVCPQNNRYGHSYRNHRGFHCGGETRNQGSLMNRFQNGYLYSNQSN